MSLTMKPAQTDRFSEENSHFAKWLEQVDENFISDFAERLKEAELTIVFDSYMGFKILADKELLIGVKQIEALELKNGSSCWALPDCSKVYVANSVAEWRELEADGLVDDELVDRFHEEAVHDFVALEIPKHELTNMLINQDASHVIYEDEGLVVFGPIDNIFHLPILEWFSDNWELRRARLIIEGVFLILGSADWPTLVPDDRRMLNSRSNFYGDFSSSDETNSSVDNLFDRYIDKYLGPMRNEDNRFNTTFVNHALSNLMTTFSRHQLTVEEIESKSTFSDGTRTIEVDPYYKREVPEKYRFWVQISIFDEDFGDCVEYRGFEEIGSGMSYFLPVLLGLDVSRTGIFQQPELHLHPAAQCEVGDVFVSAYNELGSSVLIETHSEHMILRMLRRVRETSEGLDIPSELKMKPEDIVVMYFEPKGRGTEVHKIRVDKYGDFLDPWPRGFFSERENELFPGGLG